jgi:putative ABC transport system ATP-binding protein
MAALLEAGLFSASDGEGRVLYDDVSLSVEEGCLVSLEGPSGCGKSSLLRQVTALDRAPGAQRVLAGSGFVSQNLPAWRANVTLLAQDAPILPGDVEHNLSFAFGFRNSNQDRFDQTQARELMQGVGLGHLDLSRDAATLSGGERHRLALVRGLLFNPTVLIADEPLSGLDPDSVERCFSMVLDWARQPGRAVLAVFQDPALADRADSRLRLSDGRLESVS